MKLNDEETTAHEILLHGIFLHCQWYKGTVYSEDTNQCRNWLGKTASVRNKLNLSKDCVTM